MVILLITMLAAMIGSVPREQLHGWLATVATWTLGTMLVYGVILFFGHKINRFRSERQRMLDTLTGK